MGWRKKDAVKITGCFPIQVDFSYTMMPALLSFWHKLSSGAEKLVINVFIGWKINF